MKRRIILVTSVLLVLLLFLTGCTRTDTEKALKDIKVKGFVADASVHDPSVIIGEDGAYYIFGSHMEAAKSQDLRKWTSTASGVNSKNSLFTGLFEPDYKAFDYVGKNSEGGYSVWAPDVIYNEKLGKYMMYFCTTSSFIKSNLCFALSDSLEGPYEYADTVLYSGFTEDTVNETNFYDFMPSDTKLKTYLKRPSEFNNLSWPNCIDPALFYDADGKMQMVYGSWSGGIFLLEIDEETGYPIHPEENTENRTDTYYGKHLIGGLHNSIEGPYIIYQPETEYYYLFVSYGELTSNGGYQIRVLRSKSVDGPYTDAAGQEMGVAASHAKYGVKLMGNYKLPSNPRAYMAPGHCSAFQDKDGKLYVVYHTRFDDGAEYHEPRVHQLFFTRNGWLAAAPFATAGETLRKEGYVQDEINGTWHIMTHGISIDSEINTTQEIVLEKDGSCKEQKLSVTLEKATDFVEIIWDDVHYEGVIIDMTDEAGNATRCITAVGENNQCLWAVKYLSE